MKRTLTVLGALALVLGIAAGATATTKVIVGNAQLATGSVNSRVVADNSLRLGDLQKAGRQLIVNAVAPISESRLDTDLRAKIDRPFPTPALVGVVAARDQGVPAGAERWLGVTFPTRLAAPFDSTKVQVHVSPETTAQCAGSVAAPTAAPGYLCVYLDGGTAANAASFSAKPIGTLGMRLEWKAPVAGQTVFEGSYAYGA